MQNGTFVDSLKGVCVPVELLNEKTYIWIVMVKPRILRP